MKATIILGIVAAALGGALFATVLSDDETTGASTVQSPASGGITATADRGAQARQQSAPSPIAKEGKPSLPPRPQAPAIRYIDPEDRPIRTAELNTVRDAALQAVGGGTVTDIDRSDDFGVAYEVEVVQSGLDIDVRLDRDLNVVAQDYDD